MDCIVLVIGKVNMIGKFNRMMSKEDVLQRASLARLHVQASEP